jgi:hypothetical protein
MGSKRKHNQSSAAGTGQADVPPSSKKAKVDCEQANALPHQSPASSKLNAASPDSKRQATDVTLSSTTPHQGEALGLSKSALKRKRQAQRLREAKKKPTPGEKSEQATKKIDVQHPTKKPLTKTISGKPKAPHKNAGNKPSVNGVSGNLNSKDTHVNKSRPPPTKSAASSKKHASKVERSDSVRQKPTLLQSNAGASQVVTRAPLGTKPRFSKKRERRRQKLALWKRDQASSSGPASTSEKKDADQNALDQDISTPSAKVSHTSPDDTSILHQTTQTTLLPVPKKQWIDETEQDLPAVDEILRKEVTQTSLMPRPTKEWVEENVPAQSGDSVSAPSHAVDGPEDISADAIDVSPIAAEPTSMRSPAFSAHSSPSSSAENPQPKEAESPFAAVGLPPVTQPSATRPGINTIASFSLSSRRHPVDVLAKGRKISGLSGIRMDTGSVGSVNKPAGSLKASSVPSYSGRGDVKAAFAAFNKFANGGESSDSDDESNESESEIEAQATKPAASDAVAPFVASSITTEVRALQNSQGGGAGPADSTAHTDNPAQSDSDSSGSSSDGENAAAESDHEVSKSHEMQENDECVAETPPNCNPDDVHTSDDAQEVGGDVSTQPSDNAPRIPGQQDLPLFSDFKAKHGMQPADDSIEPPTTFLGQGLGGSISNSGPDPNSIADDQRISSLQVPIGDYQASQEADELYRSIEDISREVFGSTRALPDCKPPSSSLDVTTEPFVTEIPSGHGVDLQSLQQKTPDKDVALRHIARGSSPMVYIVGGVDVAGEAVPDVRADRLDEDGGERSGPLSAEKKAGSERYGSPQSSLSSLTASPAPSDGSPSPAETSTHAAQGDGENEADPKIEPLNDSLEANDLVGATEKKKRKMTGTSSKHFSPRKQPPRQINMPVKPESIDDAKASTLEDLEEHPELSLPPDDLLQSSKTEKKGTGRTSAFFTPTSSPAKPATTSSSKSKSKTPRPPAGTSTCPVPPTTSTHFGLIQEKLWTTPFWLLIAVTFLNKTTGRSAVPIFRSLQTLYPTPEDLSQANHEDLVDLIATLGLQNQRAKKLVGIAKVWCENPPVKGRRYRALHYPNKGDGKEYKKDEVIEDDVLDDEEEGDDSPDDVRGALEIAHIPGCGPYAWDSWRIFCRDVLRGQAEDYNGKGAADPESFVPEWQRVLPLDKELRACLRWMWLREGWVWDCESGAKRTATEEERRAGELGEMKFEDDGEEKFARDAAAAAAAGEGDLLEEVEVEERGVGNADVGEKLVEDVVAVEIVPPVTPAAQKANKLRSVKKSIARRELDVVSGDEEVGSQSLRRSRRNRTTG